MRGGREPVVAREVEGVARDAWDPAQVVRAFAGRVRTIRKARSGMTIA